MILGRGSLQERWMAVNGYRMFARVNEQFRGRVAPPVVLVHGLGVSSRYMVPLAANLAQSFAVYAPDLPGFGRSEKPRRPLSLRRLAEILSRWMERADIRMPLVVGNSMGCQIIVELAALGRVPICSAVLLGPTMDRTAPYWGSQILRLLKAQFREPPLLVALQAFDYFTNGPVRTMETFQDALRHDMLGRIHLLDVPTVVARGEFDEIVSRPWVQQLTSRLPQGTLIEIPKAGHALNYNSPERTGAVVRQLAASVCAERKSQHW